MKEKEKGKEKCCKRKKRRRIEERGSKSISWSAYVRFAVGLSISWTTKCCCCCCLLLMYVVVTMVTDREKKRGRFSKCALL